MKKYTEYMNEGNSFPRGLFAYDRHGRLLGEFYKMASSQQFVWLSDNQGDFIIKVEDVYIKSL